MSKHIHADLMLEYAQVAQTTDKPWLEFEYRVVGKERWCSSLTPIAWATDREYRRKAKTIRVGEYDVPEPVREPLVEGDTYYIPAINSYGDLADECHWAGDWIDPIYLGRGLIHLTEEAAITHAKALISLTQGAEE